MNYLVEYLILPLVQIQLLLPCRDSGLNSTVFRHDSLDVILVAILPSSWQYTKSTCLEIAKFIC